jgi:hypothetical protein
MGREKREGIYGSNLKKSYGFSHDMDCKNSRLPGGTLYLNPKI